MFLQTHAASLRHAATIGTRVYAAVSANPVAVAHALMTNAFALVTAVVWTIADAKLGLEAFQHIVCVTVQQNKHLQVGKLIASKKMLVFKVQVNYTNKRTLPDVATTFCGSVFPLKLPNSGSLNESPSYTNT